MKWELQQILWANRQRAKKLISEVQHQMTKTEVGQWRLRLPQEPHPVVGNLGLPHKIHQMSQKQLIAMVDKGWKVWKKS
jgi:predicted oxidoreductase